MRRLELTFPSEPERVRPVTERVVRACTGPAGALPAPGDASSGAVDGPGSGTRRRTAGPSPEHRLRVVVGEAIANAVRHGNRDAPHRRVQVTAVAGAGEVRVAVQDEGEGFDPAAPADPTRPGRRARPGGRGLHLQRHLADEVRHEDGGRRVVLVLHIPGGLRPGGGR